MKPLVTRILAGAAGLVLAAAPLAASAQTWHGNDHNDRGFRAGDNRGRDDHRNFERGGDRFRVGYSQPVYREPYVNGYFGLAPGGFQGYYWNGGWYHHRRLSGGVWLYF